MRKQQQFDASLQPPYFTIFSNIPTEFYATNVSDFWKLPLLILVIMLSSFYKNVVTTEKPQLHQTLPYYYIFRGDYSNLKHLNKRNETAR